MFLVVLVTHALCPVTQSADSKYVVAVAMSILSEGNTHLDEYPDFIKGNQNYNIMVFGGHRYANYSIGPSLLALPFVTAMDGWHRLAHGRSYQRTLEVAYPENYKTWLRAKRFEKFIASVLVALTAALIYRIADRRLKSAWRSLVIVFVFAFCTSAWSTASRSMWQHGPTMLLFSGTLYMLLLAEERPGLASLTALPMAFSYVVRPSNIAALILLAAFVLWRFRRQFLPFLGWAALVLIPFFAWNYSIFGALVSDYYTPGAHTGEGSFFVALAGHLISPSRGLFIFSPILLLVFAGIYIKLKEKQMGAVDVLLLAAIAVHVAMMSFAARWHAGHCFGPRYMADPIPFLVWFLIPVVQKFQRPMTAARVVLAVVFILLSAASFYAHYQGATNLKCIRWNIEPTDITTHPERLWDWNDIQFLRKRRG